MITHTDAVIVPGWSGAGYIILDPITGEGAYKIGGGQNGEFLRTIATKTLFAVGLWKSFAASHPVVAKALSGSVGLVAATISKAVKIIERCNSPAAIAAILLMLLTWNMMFLGLNIALAASGVGAGLLFVVGLLEGFLEKAVFNRLTESC